ncbi:MAG: radical SAM protein [Candidatus Wallbacteria bacterium]|nr:radical SAM protein [Candidatus Wallbacteria bacterium]
MKITLINPLFDYTTFNSPNRVFQPLSLLNMAALLKPLGHELLLIDANSDGISPGSSVWDKLTADIFIVSSASVDRWQCPAVEADCLVRLLRILCGKECLLILTGPHAPANPSKYLISEKIIAVRGEPEAAILDLVEKAETRDFRKVPGILYRHGDELIYTEKRSESIFPELPLPAYELADMGKYSYSFLSGKFSLVEGSRGCSYTCPFCFKEMYPANLIEKPLEKLIPEIEHLIRMGIESIFFIDLDFCANRNRVERFCSVIIKHKLKFSWACQTRADHLDDKLLQLMSWAGCRLLEFGVESANPVTLERIGKKNSGKLNHILRKCEESGIDTILFFIIGLPGESAADHRRTYRLARRLSPAYVSFKPWVDYPRILSGIGKGGLLENHRICRKLTLRYYLHPGYLFRMLRKKKFSFLWRNFRDNFLPLIIRK